MIRTAELQRSGKRSNAYVSSSREPDRREARTSAGNLLHLQRTVGNQAAQRLVAAWRLDRQPPADGTAAVVEEPEQEAAAPEQQEEAAPEQQEEAAPRRIEFEAADGEKHALYFEGEGENAQLMVASNAKLLRNLLEREQQLNGNYYAAIAWLGATLNNTIARTREVVRLEKLRRDRPANYDALKETLMRKVVRGLTVLLPHIIQRDVYFTVDWIKPETRLYPVLFFGPKTDAVLPQYMLRTYHAARVEYDQVSMDEALRRIEDRIGAPAMKKWVDEGPHKTWPAIHRYHPHVRSALPGGGPTIGIKPEYRVRADDAGYYPMTGADATPGGAVINSALAPYGFRPEVEQLDGDHVIEMQLGGVNTLDNMWPLDMNINRAGGIWIELQDVYNVAGVQVPFVALKKVAQTTQKRIMIHLQVGDKQSQYSESYF
jgi:hypothetical protein